MPEIEGVTLKKILPVIYVVDTSGSMKGSRIAAVNEALYEYKDILLTKANENPDTEINVGVLKFASKPEWVTGDGLVDIQEFYPEELSAVREPGNLGAALVELGSKLSRNGFLNKEVGYYAPIIVFIGDGGPNDEWQETLNDLRRVNKWYTSSKKVAVAVDDSADEETLEKLSENVKSVISIGEHTAFENLINGADMPDSVLSGNSVTGDFSYDINLNKSIAVGADVSDTKSALRWIIQKHGTEVLKNRKTVETLLDDITDTNDLKYRCIKNALTIGAGGYFYNIYKKNNGYSETSKKQFILKLSENGLKAGICEYIAWVFGYAIDSKASEYIKKNKEPDLTEDYEQKPQNNKQTPSNKQTGSDNHIEQNIPHVTQPVPAKPSRKKKKALVIIAVFVVAVCGILAIIISKSNSPEKKYNKAMDCIASEDYISAYEILSNINYNNSHEVAMRIKQKYFIQKINKAKIGDEVKLGSYEQDAVLDNGNEDIEWIVLDEDNGKKLIISKYILSLRGINSTDNGSITWDKCDLRTWLNDTFLNLAFSEEDQKYILTSTITPELVDCNKQAETTYDKIFLLKASEANELISKEKNRMCSPTAFARTQGSTRRYSKDTKDSEYWYWWTATRYQMRFYLVDPDGNPFEFGISMNALMGVRPALWIDTSLENDETALPVDTQAFQNMEIGQSLYYGTYEQNNDISDGSEDIEWLILDKQPGRILVISRYILDARCYNNEITGNPWKSSDIRSWLNNEFLNEAFTKGEQTNIIESNIPAPQNHMSSTDQGGATIDKMFLLDEAEFEEYFELMMPGMWAVRTDFTKGKLTADTWILRSKGDSWEYDRNPGIWPWNKDIAVINLVAQISGNDFIYNGTEEENENGIRPAMWLKTGTNNNTEPDTDDNEKLIIKSSELEIGSVVNLGRFELDYNTFNGYETIEWMVIDKEEGKALLIDKNGIGYYTFSSTLEIYDRVNDKYHKPQFSWENCDLRKGLNNRFYNLAFNSKEKAIILDTVIKNDQYDYDSFTHTISHISNDDTVDKVFLLSCEEAGKYFQSDSDRICYPYSERESKEKGAEWITRTTTTDTNPQRKMWSIHDGIIGLYSEQLWFGSINGLVRPCIWISIDQDEPAEQTSALDTELEAS